MSDCPSFHGRAHFYMLYHDEDGNDALAGTLTITYQGIVSGQLLLRTRK